MLVKNMEGKWIPSTIPEEPVLAAQPLKATPLYLTPLEDMVFCAFKVAVVSLKALGISPPHHDQVIQDFTFQLTLQPFNALDMERAYDKLERGIREVARLAYVPENSDDQFLLLNAANIRANSHPPLTQFSEVCGVHTANLDSPLEPNGDINLGPTEDCVLDNFLSTFDTAESFGSMFTLGEAPLPNQSFVQFVPPDQPLRSPSDLSFV